MEFSRVMMTLPGKRRAENFLEQILSAATTAATAAAAAKSGKHQFHLAPF